MKSTKASILGLLGLWGLLLSPLSYAEEFAVIVNSANSFSGDAKEYFLLKADKWPSGAVVEPYDIDASSDLLLAVSRNAFIKGILGLSSPAAYKEYWIQQKSKGMTRRPQALKSFDDVVKYVKREKGGIGFVPKSKAQGVKVLSTFSP